jgi:hypothetical protein
MLGSSPTRLGAVLRPSSAFQRQGIRRLLCVSSRTSTPSLARAHPRREEDKVALHEGSPSRPRRAVARHTVAKGINVSSRFSW